MKGENLKIEVCLTPVLYPQYKNENSIVIVIDIFRATTAICTAFAYGVKELIPVATVEKAQEYKDKGYLVGAERNGSKLEQFDFGNSPYSYMTDKIKDKSVVLTTTNGTKAIDIAKDAYKLVIGSFTNFTSLCDWLIAQQCDVILLCSGWKDKMNLEDTIFAGAVADYLSKTNGFKTLSDAALTAKYLYLNAENDTYKFLKNSSHRRRLAQLNLKKDIKYSLSFDNSTIIPILKGDKLVALS